MYKVLVTGGDSQVQQSLERLLSGAETYMINANNYLDSIKTSDFTPDREYGWYRKFEKNNKKRKFKKAI